MSTDEMMVDNLAGVGGNRIVPRYESETALAERAAGRDRQAERDLVDLLRDGVRRTVFYLVGSDRDADDMTQMALIEILSSVRSFRGDCSLKYWADRITVRCAMRALKKRRRREALLNDMEMEETTPPDAEADACRGWLQQRMARLLQQLSRDCRTALVLHHVQGYKISEIAALTGARVNTVRGRLRTGRKRLGRYIDEDPALKEWVCHE